MEIRAILARNLRGLRRARSLSQEELADLAEIDRTYVSALERSVYAASIDVVDRLARALGVEAADLLIRPAKRPNAPRRGSAGPRRGHKSRGPTD
jgi:transcriptional regulator with XRE-family HTH domain